MNISRKISLGVFIFCLLLLMAYKPSNKETVISLQYTQSDIQKQFDTLYHNQQTDTGLYNGFLEQALAVCHDSAHAKETITQDVFSSIYLNFGTKQYDCVTTTVFSFPDGTITANGIFQLEPNATIAPNHDFPITGGSKAYKNITGTYTRVYENGVYRVTLRFHSL